MYKNSSTPSTTTALWHYLNTNLLDFRHENNSTPGVLIEEIRYNNTTVNFLKALFYLSHATEINDI